MNGRNWLYVLTASALAGGTLAVALLAGGGAAATAAGSATQTLHLVERGGGVRFIDSAPPRARGPFDFSPGDQAIVRRTLDQSGSRVGSLQLACTAITATRQHCAGTVKLASGTLEVAGVSSPSPVTTVAVLGGTGAYARDTGTAQAKDRHGHSDVADLTITLGG